MNIGKQNSLRSIDSSSNSALSGYIAITTTIILSLVMLVLAITFGSGILLTRSGTLTFSNKKTSHFLAISCLEHARLKLAQNSNYSGNETLTIGSNQCSILVIETSESNKIIKSRAQIMGITTNLKLTVNALTLSTASLEEVVKF